MYYELSAQQQLLSEEGAALKSKEMKLAAHLNRVEELQNSRLEAVAMTEAGDFCTVCQAPDVNCAVTGCGHRFHVHCIARWIASELRNTCPVCRSNVL